MKKSIKVFEMPTNINIPIHKEAGVYSLFLFDSLVLDMIVYKNIVKKSIKVVYINSRYRDALLSEIIIATPNKNKEVTVMGAKIIFVELSLTYDWFFEV